MRPDSKTVALFGVHPAYISLGVFLCSILGCVFSACSNSEMPSPNAPDGRSSVEILADSLEGMWRVKATGKSTILGSDESSRAMDRPTSIAEFGYDFSLGKSEVTCGEFNALMEPATGLSLDCANKDLPATDITFYDAVLFANERSKAEKFDTAYTYVGLSLDAQHHCTNLEGFALRTEANAYRLPTEAEWVLAASQGWNVENGWTADNSDYKLHPVCGKASEGEFCDMVGNAMEWVNDWLGSYSSRRFWNLVGAPDGGSLGQRVVKGGSFRNEASSIAIYTRGDVYAVTSSTHTDYVGFRLAFGAIPEPTWVGGDGNAQESRVIPLANSATVRSLTGTYRTKLVFRNDVSGNLSYIDYSSGELTVVGLPATRDAYHPDISPDGKYVAYCTGLEGVSGKSSVFVRPLSANPEESSVRLDVESAVIPRWRVLETGDTVIVYVSDAGNNKDDAAFRATSTWQVKFSNGKFGKPEKLFDGAYHGGVSKDGMLAVTGARLLRARIADSGSTIYKDARDTVWYGGEQACNASLAKDGSKRTLFLDFGGKVGQEFVGEKYGTHERLLVADSTGSLVQSVAAPSGFSFDHSEWAGNGTTDIAVAALTDASGAHTKIVAVSLKDSSVTEIAEGDELWHPALWAKELVLIDGGSILDFDSAGVYLVPGSDASHEALRVKMQLFWEHKDEIEYILVGSSRLEDGLVPDSISAGYALNMGHPMNSMDASFFIAGNYAMNHAKKLKAVVFSLDLDLWQITDEYTSSLVFGAPGYIYDMNHDFWKKELPKSFVDLVKESYPATDENWNVFYASRGYHHNDAASWGDPLVELDSTWISSKPEIAGWQMERLRNFLSVANERGVAVVGVVFPQNPKYRDTGSWGRYGPTRSAAVALMDSVLALKKTYPNFYVLDENRMGDHDYIDAMALNTDHLGYAGALKMTHRLDSLLTAWEAP